MSKLRVKYILTLRSWIMLIKIENEVRQFYPLKWKTKQKRESRRDGGRLRQSQRTILTEPDLMFGNLKYIDL